jgi:hypothetical protein
MRIEITSDPEHVQDEAAAILQEKTIYSTCPVSTGITTGDFPAPAARLAETAREAGCASSSGGRPTALF